MTSPSKNHHVSPLHNFSLPSLWTAEGASSLHRRHQLNNRSAIPSPGPATSTTPPPQRRQFADWSAGKQAVVSPLAAGGDSGDEVSLVDVAAGICGSPVEEFSLKMEEVWKAEKLPPFGVAGIKINDKKPKPPVSTPDQPEVRKTEKLPPFGVTGIKIGEKKPKPPISTPEPNSSTKIVIKLPLRKDDKTKAPVVLAKEKKVKAPTVILYEKKPKAPVVAGENKANAPVGLGEKVCKAVVEVEKKPKASGVDEVKKSKASDVDEVKKAHVVLGERSSKADIVWEKKRAKSHVVLAERSSKPDVVEGVKLSKSHVVLEERSSKDTIIEEKAKVAVVEEEQKADVAMEEENGGVVEEKAGEGDGNDGRIQEEEEILKSWNLRPRNNIRARRTVGESCERPRAAVVEKKAGPSGGTGGEKKEKIKLSIIVALSKPDTEEDLCAFNLKPSRRPKKSTKQVQTQLDRLLPGNNLVNITPETYNVSLSSLKKQG